MMIVWLRKDETAVEGRPRPIPESIDRHGVKCPGFARLVGGDPARAESILRRAHGRFIGEPPPHDPLTQRPVAVLDAPGGEVAWQIVPQVRDLFKTIRSERVASIVVQVDGLAFDGDEVAQQRMARALAVLDDTESTTWVLADNTAAQVTKQQLRQALRLAGEAQTALWVLPE